MNRSEMQREIRLHLAAMLDAQRVDELLSAMGYDPDSMAPAEWRRWSQSIAHVTRTLRTRPGIKPLKPRDGAS